MLKLRFLLAALIISLAASSQTADPKVDQYLGWLTYTGNNKISEKWGLHTEYQLRRSDFFAAPMQTLVRLGVDYKLSKTFMLTAGWAYAETFAYGDLQDADQSTKFNNFRFNEQRIWEQFVINHEKTGRFIFDSRFRLEQRWIANMVNVDGKFVRPSDEYISAHAGTEDWKFRQRARYRFRMQVPLSKAELVDNTLFLAASDEIFVNFGEKVTANIFDQNRLVLALGWRFNKDFNIQTGYQNQFIEKGNGVAKENNHTFIAALTYNLDFSKIF